MASTPRKRKITIVDIARACGVSVTTVSRILNDRPDVSPETRQRVLEYIREYGFTPQFVWQQLRSGKSHFIALHFPQEFNPPSHEIITYAAKGCQDEGYTLNVIANPLNDDELLAIFRSGQADGMILMEILTQDRRVELLQQHQIPFVMIGRCSDNTNLSYVDVDIHQGIADAIQHLVDLGHRHIGLLTLSPVLREKEYGYSTWALSGYEAACQKHGLPVFWRAADLWLGNAESVCLNLLNENPEITALLMPQPQVVNGVLRAIRSKSLKIPLDISVIGLLYESVSELITPPLTTIGFPSHEMGYEAARLLIAQLSKGDHTPRHVLLRPELNVRESTGPVRAKKFMENP